MLFFFIRDFALSLVHVVSPCPSSIRLLPLYKEHSTSMRTHTSFTFLADDEPESIYLKRAT